MHDNRKGMRKSAAKKAMMLAKGDPTQKVDASSWSPPEAMEPGVKTGMRPISARQFKRGGKVAHMEGTKAHHHAGRKARKSGGAALSANSLVNRNVKEANEEREGKKHVGGMKRGGMAGHPDVKEDKALIKSMIKPSALRGKHATKGKVENPMTQDRTPTSVPAGPMVPASQAPWKRDLDADSRPAAPTKSPDYPDKAKSLPRKDGGKVKWIQKAIKHKGALHKALHVPEGEKIPMAKIKKAEHSSNPKLAKRAHMAETLRSFHADGGHAGHGDDCRCKKCWGGAAEGKGGRMARKSGGRTKGAKTHINIMIAPQSKDDSMNRPPMPMLARPMPMPAPMPAPAPAPMGGAPMPMRPPMGGLPMGRKHGGKVEDSSKPIHIIDNASGGGLGRLQKIKAYGSARG